MAVLAIGTAEKKKIKKLIGFAETNIYTDDRLRRVLSGKIPPPGDNPRNNLKLPIGYRVTYTLEDQPFGRARHISISINRPGCPSVEAVNMILEAFNFRNRMGKLTALHVWIEDEKAINIVEALQE